MPLNKNIKLLTWFNFFTDFKLYAPVAIIYFAKVSGSYALGMSIFSITMISSALFEVPTGIYSDLIGRKKTVIFGAGIAVIYSIFYAGASSYLVLAIGAIFEGLSRSFYSGNNDALLYDTLHQTNQEHQYHEFLGKISSMFQLALAVAAILGSVIASRSFALVMWLSVISQVICLYLSLLLTEPRHYSRQSGNIFVHLREALMNFKRNRKLRLLSVSSMFSYGFGEASYQFQSAFYNTVWPVWAIGFAKVLSNLGATASFLYSGKVIKKFNEIKLLIASNIYSRIVNTIAALFPTIFSPVLMSSTSVFYGVTEVAKSTLLQKEFTHEQRATMGSLNSFLGSLFFGFTALFIGYIADNLSPAKAFLVFQVLSLSTLWIYWKIFKSHS